MYIGKKTPVTIKKSFADSPMPNERMTNEIIARCGTLRIIWTDESKRALAHLDRPLSKPNHNPSDPPITSPMLARLKLSARWSGNSPVLVRRIPDSRTASGDGRTLGEMAPTCDRNCQLANRRIGRTQGRIKEYQGLFISFSNPRSFSVRSRTRLPLC